jgi:hypothetical protein
MEDVGNCMVVWYILQTFCYFTDILHISWSFGTFLVCCTKKNLATLLRGQPQNNIPFSQSN